VSPCAAQVPTIASSYAGGTGRAGGVRSVQPVITHHRSNDGIIYSIQREPTGQSSALPTTTQPHPALPYEAHGAALASEDPATTTFNQNTSVRGVSRVPRPVGTLSREAIVASERATTTATATRAAALMSTGGGFAGITELSRPAPLSSVVLQRKITSLSHPAVNDDTARSQHRGQHAVHQPSAQPDRSLGTLGDGVSLARQPTHVHGQRSVASLLLHAQLARLARLAHLGREQLEEKNQAVPLFAWCNTTRQPEEMRV
jgi:hypothetical protein